MEQIFFFVLLGASCLIAWLRGGTPERIACVFFAVASIISTLIVSDRGAMFSEIEMGLFATDTALFLSLVGLALTADRYWPMWLASLQMVSVFMHPAFGFSETKMAFAYAVASIFWSYPMMIILVVGAFRHHRRSQAARASA